MYRGSLSEMVVPYGDPSGGWFFRNSFDAGRTWDWASMRRRSRPGVDCPQNCTVFDAVTADAEGNPVTLPHAVALYELRWRHRVEAR